MKTTLIALTLATLSTAAMAGPECTNEPKDKWMPEASMKQKLEADGYRIKVFKTTKGNCYEIYGWDKQNQKVEIYFNPVDGKIVKQVIEK